MTVKHIPTISQYAYSVGHPHGLFRTLGEPECERNAYSEPVFSAGGNAAVFKVYTLEGCCALKCYIRTGIRTARIYDYIATHPSRLLYRSRYMPGEIYVYDIGGRGEWRDTVVSEWGEGSSLGYHIRRAMHYRDTAELGRLADMFGKFTFDILSEEWGHGDIKPDNIMVTPDGSLKLLDYDAMFLPEFAGLTATETGTPYYNHPARDGRLFNKHIDDYPLALIWASLRTLASGATEHTAAPYGEMPLFAPQDVPCGNADAYTWAMDDAAGRGDAITYRLLSMLDAATPVLSDLPEIACFATIGATHSERPLEPFTRSGKWGYTDGIRDIIPPIFDNALEFSEGLAVVELGKYRHFIDASGKTVINCRCYDHVKPFHNGMAAVRSNGTWMHIDRTGNIVSPVTPDNANTPTCTTQK